MLKLFRNIRRNLLAEGRLARYLSYALGEILLVVAGILIALQVNNWNNERIERRQERHYLHRIMQDLETDLKELENVGLINDQRMLRGNWIMETLCQRSIASGLNNFSYAQAHFPNLDSLKVGSFGQTLIQLRFYRFFEVSSTTFQDILSSGKLEIIRNEEIRTAIQAHYDFINNGKHLLQRLIELNRDEFTRLMLDNYISMTNQYDLEQVEARLTDKERVCVQIENFIFTTNAVQTIMLYSQNSIKSRTEALIVAISDSLDGPLD